jgi:hypothetical protein
MLTLQEVAMKCQVKDPNIGFTELGGPVTHCLSHTLFYSSGPITC